MEQQLIIEYENLLNNLLPQIKNNLNYGGLLKLASMPERVRGFGHIKERNAKAMKEEIHNLLEELNTEEPIRLVTPEAGQHSTKDTEKEYHVG